MNVTEKSRGSAPAAVRRPETAPLALSSSAKITPGHLDRLAIVYVRQSSPKQVLEHRESTARQYAFAEQAVAFGWPRERVLTIDEDLGKSGRTTDGRDGFQRLVTEVTLNHVGMVLGLEMSRLARSSKDWHAFFEMCAIFGTLIVDEDGVYDGNDPNDRLLLGLKGIMSEMELHIMRNRLQHGRINKAQRGELFYGVPFGYVRLPTGKIDFDPDEQARAVVHLLFEKFYELGSVHSLFFWMVEHGISLPIRPQKGPNKGRLEWRRPCLATLSQTLHHPMYAGAYAYGRKPVEPKKNYAAGKGPKRKWLPLEQWRVLIRDHLPAYITWERFLKNQERMKQNRTRSDTPGTPRNGCALLPGLLVCGRCGWRMQVYYRSKYRPLYRCMHDHATATEKTCSGLSATVLDELVSSQVLRALEPAALELSLKARADLRRERERLDKHWKQKLQRARYDVELAERRYQTVDPENRLVAGTLERQWEDTLRKEREIKEEYDRYCRQAPPQLSVEDEARIADLASDIPALWNSPKTTNADRQGIIRCLIERVVVHVEPNIDNAEAVIHWIGGYESQHKFVRPVRQYAQFGDFDRLMNRVAELRAAGKTADQIADALNSEGCVPLRRDSSFNREVVYNLLVRQGFIDERTDASLLGSNEWHLTTLAQKLKMSRATLWYWASKGWIHSRRTTVQKVVIVWANAEEICRLKQLLKSSSRGILGYPKELITPKKR
jgi:DNA invertase Pin-like site-specific DNA recombinase